MNKTLVHALSSLIPIRSYRRKFRDKHKKSSRYDFDLDYGFKCDKPNPIIIDCGANIGRSVSFFLKNYPDSQILAFEADKDIFENQLIPFLTAGGKLPENIQCVNKAVWVHDNGLSFFPEGTLAGTCVNNKSDDIEPVMVDSVRLKSVIQNTGKVDFLKIDIEGAEVAVIRDCEAVLQQVDRLFVEYHSFTNRPQDLSEILSVLESNRFRYKIAEDYNKSKQYWDYTDNGNGMDCQLKIFALHPAVVKNSAFS